MTLAKETLAYLSIISKPCKNNKDILFLLLQQTVVVDSIIKRYCIRTNESSHPASDLTVAGIDMCLQSLGFFHYHLC